MFEMEKCISRRPVLRMAHKDFNALVGLALDAELERLRLFLGA